MSDTAQHVLTIGVVASENPQGADAFISALDHTSKTHEKPFKMIIDHVVLDENPTTIARQMALYDLARRYEAHHVDVALIVDPQLFDVVANVQKFVAIPLLSPAALVNTLAKLTPEGEPSIMLLGESHLPYAPESLKKKVITGQVTGGDLVEAGLALIEEGAANIVVFGMGSTEVAALLQKASIPAISLPVLAAEVALLNTPTYQQKPFKVGIIGGLGPAATVDLYDKITKATPAKTDQEHIRVVVEQNPQIPDRTACLLGDGEDPTLAMFDCARRLENDGCDAIVIPCNTAHAFVPFLECGLHTPIINMQEATMEEIKAKLGDKARIGLLATTGTVRSGLYGQRAQALDMPLFVPDEAHQAKVMNAIYGEKGAKAGFTDGECKTDLMSAAEYLVKTYDCNCLILGCTELPLILSESDAFECAGKTVMMIDPTSALARKIVRLGLATNKERHMP